MKDNPFVLPGFGQSGALSENPLLASMEMMRQAWEGLAKAGNMDPAAMGIMSMEDLDKRIADLRAVENWLRLNLSMLGSTIRGMEVQRATMATLKSVVETGMSAAGAADGRTSTSSPLEDVLKAWQGPSSMGGRQSGAESRQSGAGAFASGSAAPDTGTNRAAAEQPAAGDAQPGSPGAGAPESRANSVPSDSAQADVLGAAANAAQGWWNLLQQQFQNLAAATVASAEGAMANTAAAAAKASAASAGKSAAAGEASASKSTAAKKTTAARKSAAGKQAAAPGEPAAARKAAKKAVAKKAAKRATTARKSAG